MAEKLIVLGTDDVQALRELLARERSRTVNSRTPNVPTPSIQAPEVYIGMSEYDIPALTLGEVAGTGTGAEADDTPGHGAVCNLYRLLGNDLDAMTIESMGITKHVFNLSTTLIGKGTWFLAIRDKPGSWLALPFNAAGGGGTGGRGIHFTISGALTNEDASFNPATVLRYWGGADPGATVTVHNPDGGNGGTYVWAGKAGAWGLAHYDENADKWWISFLQGFTGTVGPFYLSQCVDNVLFTSVSDGFPSVSGLVQDNIADYV